MQKISQNNVYTILSNKYNIPYQVVEVICNHPFKFANTIISDKEDTKSIMFAYLFKLKIKNKFKDDKQTIITKSKTEKAKSS